MVGRVLQSFSVCSSRRLPPDTRTLPGHVVTMRISFANTKSHIISETSCQITFALRTEAAVHCLPGYRETAADAAIWWAPHLHVCLIRGAQKSERNYYDHCLRTTIFHHYTNGFRCRPHSAAVIKGKSYCCWYYTIMHLALYFWNNQNKVIVKNKIIIISLHSNVSNLRKCNTMLQRSMFREGLQ